MLDILRRYNVFPIAPGALFAFANLLLIGTITGAPQMEGLYQLTSDPADPAYGDYLEALGVSEPFRQVMTRIRVNLQIQKGTEEGTYKYKVITPLLIRVSTFKFGEEFEDKYVDGRMYKSVFTIEGEDTVKQELKFENVTGTSYYKFFPEGLTATQHAKDKVAVRDYKRTDKL